MRRVVEPELLDHLPPEHPDAVRSRGDLRRVNLWMRNGAHFATAFQGLSTPVRTVVELGAGDGTFMLRLARRLQGRNSNVRLTLLDLHPVVRETSLREFAQLGWTVEIIQADVHAWLAEPGEPVDLIAANLFLHHFSDLQLRSLFARVANRAGAIIACEPRRWVPAGIATRFLWLIGCNHVTRHDARVSVRAGFAGSELSALWPPESGFALREYEAGYASHLFTAIRR